MKSRVDDHSSATIPIVAVRACCGPSTASI